LTDAAWLTWGRRTGAGVGAAAGAGGAGLCAIVAAARRRAASANVPVREEDFVMTTPFVGGKDTRCGARIAATP
jgi:hypothetical protein